MQEMRDDREEVLLAQIASPHDGPGMPQISLQLSISHIRMATTIQE